MLIAVRKLFVSAQKGSFESHLMWTMVTSSAHYFILQCFIFHLQCFLFCLTTCHWNMKLLSCCKWKYKDKTKSNSNQSKCTTSADTVIYFFFYLRLFL